RCRPPPIPTLFPYTTLFRSFAVNGATARSSGPESPAATDGDAPVPVASASSTDGSGTPSPTAVTSSAPRKTAAQPDPNSLCTRRSEEHTSELQSLAYLVCRL